MTPKEATDSPGDGSVYGAFVTKQLEDQLALKESLERRASAVITTSGVLVTLLFGLVAITTRATTYVLPHSARYPLVVALCAFVIACVLALIVGVPLRYKNPSVEDLERKRRDNWWEPDRFARRRLAGTEILLIQSYRRGNKLKAWLLLGAGAAQIGALIALAVTVGIILFRG